MSLTDAKVRRAHPQERTYKLSDGNGIYLEVAPNGSKRWRLKYRLSGKEKRLSLGTYPETSLKTARSKRDEARAKVAEGIDPSATRKAERAARAEAMQNDFETVAREWWEAIHRQNVTESHAHRNLRRLENHAFPLLAKRPIAEITPGEVLTVLRRLEEKGQVENAHRLKILIGQVFRYAIPTGRADRDITADLKDALRPSGANHHPAITTPEEFGALLRAIDGYTGQPTTTAALRLLPMLFTRPGELRMAAWPDFDLEAGTWHYQPAKGGHPLLTPLPRQALTILHELRPLTGHGHYVFPANRGRNRPMSNNTINAALKSMGYDRRMVAHGFRAAARTLLVERLGYPVEIVEMQLGHAVRDMHGRAYNRATYFDQRKEMMQAWADYLYRLRSGETNVVLLGKQAS